MNKTIKNILLISLALFLLIPAIAFAHQPRINRNSQTTVIDPEISKAYYGQLQGEPHFYYIISSEDFDLYVNVLVPDIAGQKKDVSAEIFKDNQSIAILDANNFDWTKFFEPFGQSTYWEGPEYKERAIAGNYTIKVWSTNNDSKYSLAVGEIESFDVKESINALVAIPELKRDFFNESPISFILSPFGWGYILIMYVLAFIIGFIYRAVLKKTAKKTTRKVHKNIGKYDRIIRLVISFALLILAISTSWNFILLFFAGFTLFEAIFSWCGIYAAIGKNTCTI